MTKEEVQDTLIYPLMKQIIDICKEHKIPMVASIDITPEGEQGYFCTSALTTKEFNPPREYIDAVNVLYNGYVAVPQWQAIAINTWNK